MDNAKTSCSCSNIASCPPAKLRRITLSRSLGHSKAKQLMAVVQAGDVRETKRLLKAGAYVNGDDEGGECQPLVAAALAGQTIVVKVLLKAGADIEVAVPRDQCSLPPCCHVLLGGGQRALHAATGRLHESTVRVLLDSGADVNAVDHNGNTPFFLLCHTPPSEEDPDDSRRVAIARQLLQGGAEINASYGKGYYPVHYAAQFENTGLLDFILWESPAALNRRSDDGITPLCIAAMVGQAGVVAHLLSRGAQQPAAYDLQCTKGCRHVLVCPLREAVIKGHEEVVRVFLDGGMGAIGGVDGCLDLALRYTMPLWRTRMHSMLLAAEGLEGERRWANSATKGISLLHTAASYNALPIISALLRAGADETALNPTGDTPHGVVAFNVEEGATRATGDPAEEAAVHRMLEQGPAFRARSFLWPTVAGTGGVVGDCGGCVGTGVCSSRREEARDVPVSVRIWRPMRREFLVRLISRHALKGEAATENQLVVVDSPVDGSTG